MPIGGEGKRFLLLYGSQTGQAQAIADEIRDTSPSYDIHADLKCLSLTDKKFSIERESCIVIVVSTTGEGDVPDTAQKFWRRLKKRTLPSDYLKHLSYTVLGLGDTNYSTFCNCGKSVDKRLQELGAQRFYDCAWADDAVGLEVVVEPWIDDLWSALEKQLEICVPEAVPCANSGEQDNNLSANRGEQDNNLINKSIMNSSETSSTPKDVANGESEEAKLIKDPVDYGLKSTLKHLNINSDVEPDKTVGESSLLQSSQSSLCEAVLTLPVLSSQYLHLSYSTTQTLNSKSNLHNGEHFPSSTSPVTMATIVKAKRLSAPDAVKTTLEISLDIQSTDITYEPGDSIGVVCPHEDSEVDHLITRLGRQPEADLCCHIEVLKNSQKRNAVVPPFIPNPSSLRHILQTCLDIRAVPKKAFLRVLAEYTSSETEKRRLHELCSRQGAGDYTQFIRQPSLSIFDILLNFESCQPPVERIIEHLPRLQARPYSVTTCLKVNPQCLTFIFNIVNIPEGQGRRIDLKGVATGHIDKITKQIQHEEGSCNDGSVISSLRLPIFTRSNQNFRPPGDAGIPVIMIGPGTGVAPFMGFIQQRCYQKKMNPDDMFGEMWLFYGCRNRDKDFLYREKLHLYVEENILDRLIVSFSREENSTQENYVQDSLRLYQQEVMSLIDSRDAHVYVCGDARNMAANVFERFIEIVGIHKGISQAESRKYMMTLKLNKRYHEDVWT